MIKGMKMKIAASLLAAATVFGAPVAAQDTAPANSLGELLQRIQKDTRDQSAEAQRREQAFRNERAQQQRLLDEALAELEALTVEGEQLSAQFDANDLRLIELNEELNSKQGAFGELFGVARQAAGDTKALIDASNISAQHTGRTRTLAVVSETRKLPTRRELDSIWKALIGEMIYQREVVSFTARVNNVNRDGSAADVEMTRIGPFTLFVSDRGNVRFVDFDAGDSTASVLARQPASKIVSKARDVARANETRLVAGPIDPSSGQLTKLIVDAPNLSERIQQGGVPGYAILVLLAIGLVFGVLRLFQLTVTSMAVSGQARSRSPSRGNPLGRVMMAAEDARGEDLDSFERKVDAAIVRESAGLDFGLNLIKLIAAIAPLLGLLGTVIGMIVTFQQITLFGTGDPKTMAGGISQALITTVLGLVAAIPLLFIHSFCASASRGVQQKLEEQAAGMIADRAPAR